MIAFMTTSPASAPYIHRVCYADTDAAGFIYHARYLDIFERSRAEWLAQRNLSPTKLIDEFNMLLPVRELTMHFYKPGLLDDILYIDQVIEHRGRTQVKVKQNAMRKVQAGDSEDMEVIASAVIQLVCVDTSTFKPKAFPDDLFLAE
jgi:acyl-CoA thioester hydrolase